MKEKNLKKENLAMVDAVALLLSIFAFMLSFVALCISIWIYFKGGHIKTLEPDELFDALLEENDSNILFREGPWDD